MKTLTQKAIEVCEAKRMNARRRQTAAANNGAAKFWQTQIARLDNLMRKLVKRANG